VNSKTDLVRLKVERAKKHIRELQHERDSFLQKKPYVISTKRDQQTRQLIYYVESVQELPPDLSLIAGDVLQDLRSALDHLAYQLVLVPAPSGMRSGCCIWPVEEQVTDEIRRSHQLRRRGPSYGVVSVIAMLRQLTIASRLHTICSSDQRRLCSAGLLGLE
jgi:hypothetical protein